MVAERTGIPFPDTVLLAIRSIEGARDTSVPALAMLPLDLGTLEVLMRFLASGAALQPSSLLSWHVFPEGTGAVFLPPTKRYKQTSLESRHARHLWGAVGHLAVRGPLAGPMERVEVATPSMCHGGGPGRIVWDALFEGERGRVRLSTRPIARERLSRWYGYHVLTAPDEDRARRFALLAAADPQHASILLDTPGECMQSALSPEGLAPLLGADSPRIRLDTLRAIGRLQGGPAAGSRSPSLSFDSHVPAHA
jgi:hypothetical protein